MLEKSCVIRYSTLILIHKRFIYPPWGDVDIKKGIFAIVETYYLKIPIFSHDVWISKILVFSYIVLLLLQPVFEDCGSRQYFKSLAVPLQ